VPTSKNLGTVIAAIALSCSLALSLGGCSDSSPAGSSAVTPEIATTAATLVNEGLAQMASGDSAAAELTFRKVLALEPDNVYAHYNLGFIAQTNGDDRAARDAYELALASDDAFGPALYNLGILMERKDLDTAVDLYRRAIVADDSFAPAFMRLGFALVHQGLDEEGSGYLEQGIALDPAMTEVEAPSYD
jgi:Tfp pilus assembly protein PilF